jgi:multidrug transporter EmrE-like cation transporter
MSASMAVRFALALGAAICFVAGCMFMKPAAGLTRLAPTLAVFACFAAGLVLDMLLVRTGGEVGSAYAVIVGLETVMAVALAAWLFDEAVTSRRALAIVLVILGVVLLATEAPTEHTSAHAAAVAPVSAIEPAAQLGASADPQLGVDPLEVRIDGAA